MKGSIYSTRYQRMLERLRSARRESRMSQEQVAEALGVYRTFVTKCESGERRIDALELQMFAELYGRDLPYFVLDDLNGAPETFVFRRGDTLLSVAVTKEGRKVAVSIDTASPAPDEEGDAEGC